VCVYVCFAPEIPVLLSYTFSAIYMYMHSSPGFDIIFCLHETFGAEAMRCSSVCFAWLAPRARESDTAQYFYNVVGAPIIQ